MKLRLAALSALVLLSAGCLEQETKPGQVPAAFFYKGKPVDPYCFYEDAASVGGGSISLDVCTGKSKSKPSYKDDNYYGVDIVDQDGGMSQPYVCYKYLGAGGENHILQVVSSGGGTGQFSDVRIVSLKDGLMRTITSIASGDRCNGGIADASVAQGVVSYSQNITPFDLIELSNGNQARLKAYDDISACAACCVGTADYVGGNLKSVTLADPDDDMLSEGGSPLETCFNKQQEEAAAKGRTLDLERLSAFGKAFNKACGGLKH